MFLCIAFPSCKGRKELYVLMKKTVFIIAIAIVAFEIVGCNKSEKEIDKEYSSGVVLIKNTGYYELKISDDISAYFTDYSEENGLSNFTLDEDSIVTVTAFGTGFFVSEKGEIATNNHVVGAMISEKQALKAKNKVITALKNVCRSEYNDYDQVLGEINTALFAYIYTDTYDTDYNKLREAQSVCESYMNEYSAIYNYLCNVDVSNVEFSYNHHISVAYNDEYVTSSTDFIPCVLKKTDTKNDLAIIQLKNKKTPEGKYIFDIPANNPMETTSLFYPGKNDKLFMIGFNLGPNLAITENGVKSQCTTGMVSQDRETNYLYSIPSLPGSSGAPVVNQKGELVAVNFAGIGSTQSFNYGVKVKYLRELLKK